MNVILNLKKNCSISFGSNNINNLRCVKCDPLLNWVKKKQWRIAGSNSVCICVYVCVRVYVGRKYRNESSGSSSKSIYISSWRSKCGGWSWDECTLVPLHYCLAYRSERERESEGGGGRERKKRMAKLSRSKEVSSCQFILYAASAAAADFCMV